MQVGKIPLNGTIFPKPGGLLSWITTSAGRSIRLFCMGKMICSGMLDRCQNITWLVSHMGGPIHTLLARIDRARHQSSAKKSPAEYLKSFYYDTAGPSHPGAVMGAVYTVGIDHILFGTDLPFGEDGDYVEIALNCVEGADLSLEQKDLIYRGNASRIFKL